MTMRKIDTPVANIVFAAAPKPWNRECRPTGFCHGTGERYRGRWRWSGGGPTAIPTTAASTHCQRQS